MRNLMKMHIHIWNEKLTWEFARTCKCFNMQIRLVSQVHFILRSRKAHIFYMLKILLFQVLSIDDILWFVRGICYHNLVGVIFKFDHDYAVWIIVKVTCLTSYRHRYIIIMMHLHIHLVWMQDLNNVLYIFRQHGYPCRETKWRYN